MKFRGFYYIFYVWQNKKYYHNNNILFEDDTDKIQHNGFGKKLLARAEEIAIFNGYKKIAVIAGVGVREYYRNNGYTIDSDEGCYQIKLLKVNILIFMSNQITRIVLDIILNIKFQILLCFLMYMIINFK